MLGIFAVGFWLFYHWATSSASMDVGQARDIVARLERTNEITDRTCGADGGRATVEPGYWESVPNQTIKRNFMLVLSAVCVAEGKSPEISLLEKRTGRTLAMFDGRNIVQ